MKYFLIAILALISIGVGVMLFLQNDYSATSTPTETENGSTVDLVESEPGQVDSDVETDDTDTSDIPSRGPESTIGQSAGGHEIRAHHFGSGQNEVLFIGGIHGGYSLNSVVVAYEMIDYLTNNPEVVPNGMTVTVIPTLNADGVTAAVGTTDRLSANQVTGDVSNRIPTRFNANDVDLNRNFGCDWQATGTWQNRSVSGGSAAFSEPETQAIRDYVQTHNIQAAVAWYSAAGGVYGSDCNGQAPAETQTLVNRFADASDYPAHQSFDAYPITGDMMNWLAQENIPAISVLLSDHTNSEWDKNRAGIIAILNHLAR